MFVREVQKLAEIRTSRIAFVCIVGKCMHEVHKEIRICTSRKYVVHELEGREVGTWHRRRKIRSPAATDQALRGARPMGSPRA